VVVGVGGGLGGGLDGGEISISGSNVQLLDRESTITRIRETIRYFIFTLCIANFIIAYRQNQDKDKGLGRFINPHQPLLIEFSPSLTGRGGEKRT
jgi:hypothetical protein